MTKNRKRVEVFIILVMTLIISASASVSRNTVAGEEPAEQNLITSPGVTAGADTMLTTEASVYACAAYANGNGVTAGVAEVVDDYKDLPFIVQLVEVSVASAPTEEMLEIANIHAEWSDKLMANIEKEMNVRAEASADSALVGKLKKGDLATVLAKEGEWYKISSGNVEGYVKAQYCLTGDDAYAYAMKNCHTTVTSTTSGLRIRTAPSTDSKSVKSIGKGDTILMDASAEEVDGWVAVIYKKNTCYVSADYVTLALNTGSALTMDEIAEIKRKEAEALAAAKAKQVASPGMINNGGLAASVDDVTLLAALISCEGGNQPYEGQVAIGAVVVNRVKSSRYPNTIAEVIYAKSQFTPANNGKLAKKLESGTISETTMQAAEAALAGDSPVGGACNFRQTKTGHEGIAIGGHVFY